MAKKVEAMEEELNTLTDKLPGIELPEKVCNGTYLRVDISDICGTATFPQE